MLTTSFLQEGEGGVFDLFQHIMFLIIYVNIYIIHLENVLIVSGVARFCVKKTNAGEFQYAESTEIVDDFPIFSKCRNELIMYLL